MGRRLGARCGAGEIATGAAPAHSARSPTPRPHASAFNALNPSSPTPQSKQTPPKPTHPKPLHHPHHTKQPTQTTPRRQESFLGKLVLHITVFAILAIRSSSDLDKFKNLLDEATFYDRQWAASWDGVKRPSETEK